MSRDEDCMPSSVTEAVPSRPRLRYALLAHPSVQAVRVLGKLALAWLLARGDHGEIRFGEAMMAGLVAYAVSHVAAFGFDDATIYAPRLSSGVWKRMRQWHLWLGLGAGAVLALGGGLLHALDPAGPGLPSLGLLIAGLAPMVVIANMAVLPTALLVRLRSYKRVFLIDVLSVAALTITMVGAAAAGLGAWSVVLGLTANAIVACLVATWSAQPMGLPDLAPDDERAQAELVDAAVGVRWPETRRYGRHMTGAAVFGFVGERADAFAVRVGLGAASFGLYELAHGLSSHVVGYAANLAERLLFPSLAQRGRSATAEPGPAFGEALRVWLAYLLPGHIVLAAVAAPLIVLIVPADYRSAGPVLAWLALAAGMRCGELISQAGLKAAGRSQLVPRLALVRLVLLMGALTWAVPRGVEAAAAAVCIARASGALVLMLPAITAFTPEAVATGGALRSGALTLGLWTPLFLGLVAWAPFAALAPLPGLVLVGGSGLLAWIVVRVLVDRATVAREWAFLSNRVRADGGAS